MPDIVIQFFQTDIIWTFFEDLTSIGKHISPLNARRSPVPSEPLPGALTTRNGRWQIFIACARSVSLQDLVIARTPFPHLQALTATLSRMPLLFP